MTAERGAPAAALPLPAMFLGIVAGTLCVPVRAQDSALADGLERLAKQVAGVIAREGGEKAVGVGDFIGSPRLRAAGGPGIAPLLAAALEAEGVAVRGLAPCQIRGIFKAADGRAAADDSFDSVALRIEATMLDSDDRLLEKLAIDIFGDAPLLILGGTADLPSTKRGETSPEREEAKRQAIRAPRAAVAGSEVRANDDSPFGIEVLVATQARQPRVVNGRAFVDVGKDEEYVVRLHNWSGFPATVTLTVDGLSMFAFREGGDAGSRVLVPPGSAVDVPGWHVKAAEFRGFRPGRHGMAARDRLANEVLLRPGRADERTVITTRFHRAATGSCRGPCGRLEAPAWEHLLTPCPNCDRVLRGRHDTYVDYPGSSFVSVRIER